MRLGAAPTPMLRVTSEPASMRVTVSSVVLVTHTEPPPTTMPAGSRPTAIGRCSPVRTSTRVTESLRRPITHTAPSPTARSWTPSGIGIALTIRWALGLTRTMVPGAPRMPTQTPRSPAATPTTLPGYGRSIGAPSRRCERRPIAMSVDWLWLPTPRRAAAAAGPPRQPSDHRREAGARAARRAQDREAVVAAAPDPDETAGRHGADRARADGH